MVETQKVEVWLKQNERTQAWLARKVGITPPHLNAWLRGRRPMSEKVMGNLSEVMQDDQPVVPATT